MTAFGLRGSSLALTLILLLLGAASLNARGLTAPPPPFTGGNAGAWLAGGSLFDPSNPLGPDFFIPTGFGGGGSIGGFEWGGTGGTGGTNNNRGGLGCPGTCLKESWTGPCKYLCECYWPTPDPRDKWPKSGTTVTGRCERTGDGELGCVDEGTSCTVVIP